REQAVEVLGDWLARHAMELPGLDPAGPAARAIRPVPLHCASQLRGGHRRTGRRGYDGRSPHFRSCLTRAVRPGTRRADQVREPDAGGGALVTMRGAITRTVLLPAALALA